MAKIQNENVQGIMGLSFLEELKLPILVMKQLDCSLHELLSCVSDIDLPQKQSLLLGVAQGLQYLHRLPVVHQDLTARNVLLTSSLVPKISDLSNARLVGLHPGKLHLCCEETISYMPPEVFQESSPVISSQLDVFSFGHLALFTLTQVRKNECINSS